MGGRGLGIQEPEPEPEPEPSPSPSPSPGPSPRPGYSKVGKSGNGKDKKKKRDKGAGITQANAFSLLGPESSDSGDSDSDFESVNGDASSDGGRDTNDNDSNAKDHSEELKFKVPMRELGLLRGYGDQNIKRAEERHGVYSIQVESNGQVVMRGESLGCLEAAKQALQIVEDTLNVPKQQFDAYVRRFRTDSAKARRIDEIWKETSARVSWEKDSRKSRKSPNPAMCQFSIMGPQVALDIALAALQEELEEAVQQQPPQPPPPKQMQELPNRNGRAPAGKTTKQESEQAESGADAPVEPKRGPPAETTSPSKESALPPLPEGLWEKIRLPCDERWETVLVSENLSSDSDEVEVNTLVPPVVVARIARRVFPTLRNTDAVSMAYRTVPSDAAGMIQVADLKQLMHNLVFINNHWPAVYALKRNAGYDMDLITFRGSWQSFCLSPTRTEGAKETGTDTADEIDSVFAQLMDERFRKTVEAKQQIKEAAAEADEEEEESDLPPTERPTRASFDEFISALAMHYADDEEADGGFAADLEEKLALCRELKTAGNESYKGENWAEAIEHYTRALDAIKACEAEAKETDPATLLQSPFPDLRRLLPRGLHPELHGGLRSGVHRLVPGHRLHRAVLATRHNLGRCRQRHGTLTDGRPSAARKRGGLAPPAHRGLQAAARISSCAVTPQSPLPQRSSHVCLRIESMNEVSQKLCVLPASTLPKYRGHQRRQRLCPAPSLFPNSNAASRSRFRTGASLLPMEADVRQWWMDGLAGSVADPPRGLHACLIDLCSVRRRFELRAHAGPPATGHGCRPGWWCGPRRYRRRRRRRRRQRSQRRRRRRRRRRRFKHRGSEVGWWRRRRRSAEGAEVEKEEEEEALSSLYWTGLDNEKASMIWLSAGTMLRLS
eukprot:COSAG06_NODE_6035_length_3140_cov_1.925682_1_plen_896_part_10